jgi:hypothetical protein
MKEHPTEDYIIEGWYLSRQERKPWPQMPRCWRLVANCSTEVLFLSWIPKAPWPPPEPVDYDALGNLDEEVRTVIMWSPIVVCPTDDLETMEDVPDASWGWRTFIWVRSQRYEQLGAELEQLRTTSAAVRVRSLADDSELRHLLEVDLPQAKGLSDYDRRMLCIPSFEEATLRRNPRVLE